MNPELGLILLGDLMLGRGVDKAMETLGVRQVWGGTLPLLTGGFTEQQIVAGNIQCAITDSSEETEKDPNRFNARLSPNHVSSLKVAGIDYLSLANDHSMDYMLQGLRDTQKILKSSGIKYSGAGLPDEALEPAYVTKGGLHFAFFAFSDHLEPANESGQKAGINYVNPQNYEKDLFVDAFLKARSHGADFIAVSIHWGPKWVMHPSEPIVQLAHVMVDAGADIIYGHGSYNFQGIEVYSDRPILYGAGSFLNDYAPDIQYRNDLTFVFCIRIVGKTLTRLEMVPTRLHHVSEGGEVLPKVMKATSYDKDRALEKMQKHCRFFATEIEVTPDGLAIPLKWEAPTPKRKTPKKGIAVSSPFHGK